MMMIIIIIIIIIITLASKQNIDFGYYNCTDLMLRNVKN